MSNVQTHTTTTRVHGPHFSVPSNGAAPPPNLSSLQVALEQVAFDSADKPTAIRCYLEIAKSLTNAVDVAYTTRSNAELGQILTVKSSQIFQQKSTQELIRHWSATANSESSVQVNKISGRSETIATVPIFVNGRAIEALSAALLVPRGEIEPFVVSLQLVATAIGAWFTRSTSVNHAHEAHASSAIVELMAQCHEAINLEEAAFILANEMQKLAGCETVAIALCSNGSRRAKVVALSGSGAIDQRSEVVRDMTEAANEAIDREKLTVWPPLSTNDHHTTLIHQQLVKNSRYKAVVSHPIETDDDVLGAWLFLGEPNALHHPQLLNIVQAASQPVATTLALRKLADAGPLQRVRRVVRGTPESRRFRWKLCFGAIAAALLMLIPIPHKIACDCLVEPTVRRFATVPFNGILQDSLVEPGDFVSAHQVIARMDDRDLRLEKSEAIKTRSTNEKEVDRQRADEQIAQAQIARLRSQEASARLELIQYKMDHSEIKSPISGVVIDGDLEDVQGASVQRGQTLFEIAPLDSLELKLLIPESDISFVSADMSVTARLDGAPGVDIDATLDRINPRAKADTGTNVFAAEAALPEQNEMLRPGMSGTAKIIGPKRPIGWILFHRLYQEVTDMIEW